MKILPITNTGTRLKQRPYQSQVSFRAAKPQKIFSREIFSMEGDLKKFYNDSKRYNDVLKEYAHFDMNSRDFNGETIFSKALRESNNFFTSLVNMEKRGAIEGVDWNAVDRNGDNLLMIAFKSDNSYLNNNLKAVVNLANEGKIDVNYVNEQAGYSLPQLALSQYNYSRFSHIFELKDLDFTKTALHGDFDPIVRLAIKKGITPHQFLKLVCHKSLDMTKSNTRELINYINEADNSDYHYRNPRNNERKALSDYEKRKYIEAIETALKINASRKTEKYYQENGTLTLDQIIRHVEHTDDEIAINRSLNETGETIAHFLAETYIGPNDTKSIEKVKKLIIKMRSASCYFWKEDSLGRTPLMIALESKNFVVAKAIIEKMHASEFRYMTSIECGSHPCCAVQNSKMNHIPALWNIIADLDPKERKELGTLLIERIKSN